MGVINEKSAKPFIKWVGGKTQLLDEVRKSLPSNLKDMKDVTYGDTCKLPWHNVT